MNFQSLALGVALNLLRAVGCAAISATATTAAIATVPDHVHLAVDIVVPHDETSGAGDALGIYALRLLPCPNSAQQGSTQTGLMERLRTSALVIAERTFGLLIGTAHANHREKFDGPASAEFGKRVALDHAATTRVGTLIAPLSRYCKVSIVLARLPRQGNEPVLPFSLRLSKSPTEALVIDYREDLEIPLSKPWTTDASPAKLSVVLRPRRALQVLNLKGIEDGERMQRAIVSLATEATADINP